MEVLFRPRAEEDLQGIYNYIARESGNADMAFAFMWRLREACLSLDQYPERGAPRDDILKGLRILVFESRSVIAYFVKTGRVEIAGVFHGGQDWHSIMRGK